MRVLFWGTPHFAAPALRALLEEGHDVVGVVTQPDRPKGRGQALAMSPVKEAALRHGLPVLQPERIRRPEVVAQLAELKPDAMVVVDRNGPAALVTSRKPDDLDAFDRALVEVFASA